MSKPSQPDDSLRAKLEKAAETYASSRGWVWRLPVRVELQQAAGDHRTWVIHSNAFAVGMNARIVIRENDLAIVEAGYIPR
jgi:hypothetical protein